MEGTMNETLKNYLYDIPGDIISITKYPTCLSIFYMSKMGANKRTFSLIKDITIDEVFDCLNIERVDGKKFNPYIAFDSETDKWELFNVQTFVVNNASILYVGRYAHVLGFNINTIPVFVVNPEKFITKVLEKYEPDHYYVKYFVNLLKNLTNFIENLNSNLKLLIEM